MALRARPIPVVNRPTGAPPMEPVSPDPQFYADEFQPKENTPEPVVEASGNTITITATAPPEPEIDETHLSEATRAELAAGRQVAARQRNRQQAELDAGKAAVAAAAAKQASTTLPV